jgi:hypothetical protein
MTAQRPAHLNTIYFKGKIRDFPADKQLEILGRKG